MVVRVPVVDQVAIDRRVGHSHLTEHGLRDDPLAQALVPVVEDVCAALRTSIT